LDQPMTECHKAHAQEAGTRPPSPNYRKNCHKWPKLSDTA